MPIFSTGISLRYVVKVPGSILITISHKGSSAGKTSKKKRKERKRIQCFSFEIQKGNRVTHQPRLLCHSLPFNSLNKSFRALTERKELVSHDQMDLRFLTLSACRWRYQWVRSAKENLHEKCSPRKLAKHFRIYGPTRLNNFHVIMEASVASFFGGQTRLVNSLEATRLSVGNEERENCRCCTFYFEHSWKKPDVLSFCEPFYTWRSVRIQRLEKGRAHANHSGCCWSTLSLFCADSRLLCQTLPRATKRAFVDWSSPSRLPW